jgi:flagellar motor switch protein FliN/FliY
MSEQSVQIDAVSEEFADEPVVTISDREVVRKQTGTGLQFSASGQTTIDMLMDVTLQVSVELGRTRLSVRQVLDLQKGSVVELDRMAGDAVDVFVNDHLIAQGEVVVVDDKFGVRISQLISPNREGGAA